MLSPRRSARMTHIIGPCSNSPTHIVSVPVVFSLVHARVSIDLTKATYATTSWLKLSQIENSHLHWDPN